MNDNSLKRLIVILLGVSIFIFGAHTWYQSGLNIPMPVRYDWTGDTETVPAFLVMLIGTAIVIYGLLYKYFVYFWPKADIIRDAKCWNQ